MFSIWKSESEYSGYERTKEKVNGAEEEKEENT